MPKWYGTLLTASAQRPLVRPLSDTGVDLTGFRQNWTDRRPTVASASVKQSVVLDRANQLLVPDPDRKRKRLKASWKLLLWNSGNTELLDYRVHYSPKPAWRRMHLQALALSLISSSLPSTSPTVTGAVSKSIAALLAPGAPTSSVRTSRQTRMAHSFSTGRSSFPSTN